MYIYMYMYMYVHTDAYVYASIYVLLTLYVKPQDGLTCRQIEHLPADLGSSHQWGLCMAPGRAPSHPSEKRVKWISSWGNIEKQISVIMIYINRYELDI